MIGLIKLTNYLLDRQISQLEKAFLRDGGLRERMTRAHVTERAKPGDHIDYSEQILQEHL